MRRQVSKTVREQLTARASEFHISLDDVAITDLKFGQELAKAIESKQVLRQSRPCNQIGPLVVHLLRFPLTFFCCRWLSRMPNAPNSSS